MLHGAWEHSVYIEEAISVTRGCNNVTLRYIMRAAAFVYIRASTVLLGAFSTAMFIEIGEAIITVMVGETRLVDMLVKP